MTITEFHSATVAALASEPNEVILKELVKQAQQLADMVGWASGIIDKEGKVSDAFLQLQAKARSQFESNRDPSIAQLHDAIGDILAAVLRHDDDLTPSSLEEEQPF